jgi:hypothetical protein
MLDRDKDGVVGAEELAFVAHFGQAQHGGGSKRPLLDGQISVNELMGWMERYSDAKGDKEVFNTIAH